MIKRSLTAAAFSLLMAAGLASVPAHAAPHTPAVKDVAFGKVPTPPKPDSKRDGAPVPANPRSFKKNTMPPAPPTAAKRTACSPVCMIYAGRQRTTGGNVTAVSTDAGVAVPSMDQVDSHTLWEISVHADGAVGSRCNMVEFGWNRDRGLYGEVYPALTTRLFGGVQYCDASGNPVFCGYNGGCGYQDYGPNTLDLGDDISSLNGVVKRWQIVHDDSTHLWWLWMDDWIGSWPDSLNHGQSFTRVQFLQTFDEIAAWHSPTCTDAGNSWLADQNATPSSHKGQQVSSLNEAVNNGSYALAPYAVTVETTASKWNVDEVSNYSSYYGGPGYSPNPGACP